MNDLNDFFSSFLEGLASYLPNVLGALLILLIGYIVARVVRRLIKTGLNKANLNEHLAGKANTRINVEDLLSKFVYYIILIIVLMVTLSILNVEGVLEPLKNMVNEFLAFIPNLIAAALITFAGYILAKIVSEIASALVGSIEALSERLGLSDNISLDSIVKKVVFVLVFIPLLIVAFDALEMQAISGPATDMLNTILAAIPNILAAIIILVVFYLIAKFLTPIVTDILKQAGADKLPEKLGLSKAMGQNSSLSKMTGKLLFFFIMFFGLISAFDKVELYSISGLLSDLLELSAQILFGLIIIAVGNFIANIAYRSLKDTADGKTAATIARYTVLGLFVAIALRTMGIANDIVNLAFGLTLGAAAVAFALAFGLGGREAAGKQMEHLLSNFRDEKSSGSSKTLDEGKKSGSRRDDSDRPSPQQ